jgi:hypothetical protein
MRESSSIPAFESFAGRAFSFYPAIRNVEYNEWTYGRETWSEILFVNSKTGQEIWIPRHFIGRISSAEEPVLIVGLKWELELKGGAVWPFERRLIEMPGPPGPGAHAASPKAEAGPGPLPPVPASTDSQMGRLILYAVAMGLGACLLVVLFAFEGAPRPQDWLRRRAPATKDQQYLTLNREDTYHDVVRKLGPPDREQWITPESAAVHFHALWYSQRSYVVVLMGAERGGVRYIGTIHAATRAPLDEVPLPGGGSTGAMLRTLPKF